jgi:hypothetical protein
MTGPGICIMRESPGHNPYAAPVSSTGTVPDPIETRATKLAGVVVAGAGAVRLIFWSVAMCAGARHAGELLGRFPRGVKMTVTSELLPFLGFGTLAPIQALLAIPLLRASRRFRWPTIVVQALLMIVPLMVLRDSLAPAAHSFSVALAVVNLLIAGLPTGVVILLLFGQQTHHRLRRAWMAIAFLILMWSIRMTGLL